MSGDDGIAPCGGSGGLLPVPTLLHKMIDAATCDTQGSKTLTYEVQSDSVDYEAPACLMNCSLTGVIQSNSDQLDPILCLCHSFQKYLVSVNH